MEELKRARMRPRDGSQCLERAHELIGPRPPVWQAQPEPSPGADQPARDAEEPTAQRLGDEQLPTYGKCPERCDRTMLSRIAVWGRSRTPTPR
jgi:hypothetical protein